MSSPSSFRHHLLPSGPLASVSAEDSRRISCWYLLTVILTILSSAFACFLLINSLVQYLNVDHILEECTIDWNAHVPCHYLGLWLRFHGPESLYDKRQFVVVFNSIVIALSISFLVSSIILILGIAKNSSYAMTPWIAVKSTIALFLFGLFLAEFTYPVYSQYLAIIIISLVFDILYGISGLVAYCQIRNHDKKLNLINNLNYIHLTTLD